MSKHQLVLKGDCLDILEDLPASSYDSLVTDPPAGIAFMGKDWDKDKGGRDQWIEWMTTVMSECLRVLKPGAHGFVWALPRTSHWTATALENAGFDIRDVVTHLFGTGFPKSLNVGKALKQWDGWGTALKPASEHWLLIRKPLAEKTVAKNVVMYGTGAINIDGSRLAKGGRFPANLILSGDAPGMLDEQSGELVSKWGVQKDLSQGDKSMFGLDVSKGVNSYIGDKGGASRFFYCPKASKSERNEGLEGMPKKYNDFQRESSGLSQGKHPVTGERSGARCQPKENHHPTVKAQKLMQYLIRMITPPGGKVLDPFAGSGSTGVAAKSLGFEFLGIEADKEYTEIARKRIGC